MKRLFVFFYCMAALGGVYAEERYRVSVSESGAVAVERVESRKADASDGLRRLAPAVATSTKHTKGAERADSPSVDEVLESETADIPNDPLSQPPLTKEQEANEAPLSVATSKEREQQEQRVLNPFERAFQEAEGQSPYEEAKFDTSEYIDGDVLLGEEPPVDQSAQPFFVTTDASGQEQVIFYSPTERQRRQTQIETGYKLSAATVYKKRNIDDARSLGIPDAADPIAVRILSSGANELKDYFESFSERCCERLPKAGVKVLTFDRSEHLPVEQTQSVFPFSEGESRFRIFKLPSLTQDYLLELRSFIRTYRDEGVQDGVFFPQVITLDINMRPLRVITDLVLEYSAETWRQYGYLKGVFKIDRTLNKEEEFVLVNTTRQSLDTVSEYQTAEGTILIRHMETGQLGIKAIKSGLIVN